MLSDFSATVQLRQLGVSDEELAACHFVNLASAEHLDMLSFKLAPSIAPEQLLSVLPLMKPYLLYRDFFAGGALAHSTIASDAFQYLTIYESAIEVAISRNYRTAQSHNASRPRGFEINGERASLKKLVDRFAKKPESRGFTATELWPQFFSFLEANNLEVEDNDASYSFYADDDRLVRIGRRTFDNLLSRSRKPLSR